MPVRIPGSGTSCFQLPACMPVQLGQQPGQSWARRDLFEHPTSPRRAHSVHIAAPCHPLMLRMPELMLTNTSRLHRPTRCCVSQHVPSSVQLLLSMGCAAWSTARVSPSCDLQICPQHLQPLPKARYAFGCLTSKELETHDPKANRKSRVSEGDERVGLCEC